MLLQVQARERERYRGMSMTPLKNLTDATRSNKANADMLGLHHEQLKRWLANDAHITPEGNVYIRTKGKIKLGEKG